MYKEFMNSVNIEKFAAFLDGNLSKNEMQQFMQQAEHDEMLHQLLDANSIVDTTVAGFTDTDLQLPPEIAGLDFELPVIPPDGITPLVTLSPEPLNSIFAASAICASEDDVPAFSDINEDDNLSSDDDFHDDSSHIMLDDDGLDSNDNLSGLFIDDL